MTRHPLPSTLSCGGLIIQPAATATPRQESQWALRQASVLSGCVGYHLPLHRQVARLHPQCTRTQGPGLLGSCHGSVNTGTHWHTVGQCDCDCWRSVLSSFSGDFPPRRLSQLNWSLIDINSINREMKKRRLEKAQECMWLPGPPSGFSLPSWDTFF